jgi:hypothetical protein
MMLVQNELLEDGTYNGIIIYGSEIQSNLSTRNIILYKIETDYSITLFEGVPIYNQTVKADILSNETFRFNL